ncbi:unnamed protein product, partial [Choristocarpus tenellus]
MPNDMEHSTSPLFNVQIYADMVCPWSYIGSENMLKGISSTKSASFHVTWHPYMMAAGIPEGGQDLDSFLSSFSAQNGRDPDACRSVVDRATSQSGQLCFQPNHIMANLWLAFCRAAGLTIDKRRKIYNSTNALRLMRLAKEQDPTGKDGKQTQLAGVIFRAYFKHRADISNIEVLENLAKTAGVEKAGDYLRGCGSDTDIFGEMLEETRVNKVIGAPYFVISREGYPGVYRLVGAQGPQVFRKAFNSLLIEKSKLVAMLKAKQASKRGMPPPPPLSFRAATPVQPSARPEKRQRVLIKDEPLPPRPSCVSLKPQLWQLHQSSSPPPHLPPHSGCMGDVARGWRTNERARQEMLDQATVVEGREKERQSRDAVSKQPQPFRLAREGSLVPPPAASEWASSCPRASTLPPKSLGRGGVMGKDCCDPQDLHGFGLRQGSPGAGLTKAAVRRGVGGTDEDMKGSREEVEKGEWYPLKGKVNWRDVGCEKEQDSTGIPDSDHQAAQTILQLGARCSGPCKQEVEKEQEGKIKKCRPGVR